MSDRSSNEREVRKLGKRGDGVGLTVPIEIIRTMGWKVKQKVTVKRWGKNKLVVEDWKDK